MLANSPQLSPIEFDALTLLDLSIFVERSFREINPNKPYLDNFHIHHIAAELEAMRRGENPRLIVSIPPRNLKSHIVSVAFPAWLLGHDPNAEVICVSYGERLAESLSYQTRKIMQSHWYKQLFPKTRLSPTRQAVDNFYTTAGGFRMATSITGTITGFGAQYILVDDPMTPLASLSDSERDQVNDWYRHSLVSRLNEKLSGSIAIIQQRLHEEDLTGYVQKKETWKVISLAAIAPTDETYVIPSALGTLTHHRKEGEALHPEREPLELLAKIKREQGPEYFAAQYLQAPVQPGGNMIKIGNFQRFDLKAPPKFEWTMQSWDTASKSTEISGWSVCTVWGAYKGRIYLIDVIRDRFQFDGLLNTALALARGQFHGHPPPDYLLVEDKSSGQALIQELKRLNIRNVEGVIPVTDKVTRMHAHTAVIANGFVYIPHEAPWMPDFLEELIGFPKRFHKDQVDSMSQALKKFNYQPDQDPHIEFMRREVEEMHAKKNGISPENRIVSIRTTGGSNYVTGRYGAGYYVGAGGIFKMPRFDAEILAKIDGWTIADEPETGLDLGPQESVTGSVPGGPVAT